MLRPLSVDDRDSLAQVYADPAVARYIGGNRLTEEAITDQVRRFAAEWAERGYGQSAVLRREDARFIGRIGLYYFAEWDEVELGYALATHAQGQGLATEGCRAWIARARREPSLSHLIAAIHPDNQASLALAEKLGFIFDRHDVTANGIRTPVYRLDL